MNSSDDQRSPRRQPRVPRTYLVNAAFWGTCAFVLQLTIELASGSGLTLATLVRSALLGLFVTTFVFLASLVIAKTDFGSPAVAALVIVVIQGLLMVTGEEGNLVSVVAFTLMSFGVVVMTGFWRLWAVGKRRPHERTAVVIASAVTSMAGLTLVFGYATTYLYANGHLRVECPQQKKCSVPRPLILSMESEYLWHFADTIPVLKVPESANWDEPVKLDDAVSGALLLIYKILVVVPVIGVVADIFRADEDDEADTGGA